MEERGPNLLWPDITLELVVIRFHQIQSTVVQAHRRQGWENGGSKPGMESANWKQEVKMSDLQGISIFFLLSKSPSIQDCFRGASDLMGRSCSREILVCAGKYQPTSNLCRKHVPGSLCFHCLF